MMIKMMLKWLLIILLLSLFYLFSPGLSLYSWAPFASIWARIVLIACVLALLFRHRIAQLFTMLVNAVRFAHESMLKRKQSYFKLYGEALGVIDADLASGTGKPLFLLLCDERHNDQGQWITDAAVGQRALNRLDLKDEEGHTVATWASNSESLLCCLHPSALNSVLWDLIMRRLKRYRHAQPIQGLLILKSTQCIDQEQAFNPAAAVVQAVSDRFHYALPTYCVCMDEGSLGLGAYAEHCIEGRSRHEPFGFYFSEQDDLRSSRGVKAAVTHHAKQLRQALRRRVLTADLATLDPHARQLIESLPGQVDTLAARCASRALPLIEQGAALRGLFFIASDEADLWQTSDPSRSIYHADQLSRFGFDVGSGAAPPQGRAASDQQRHRSTLFFERLMRRELLDEARCAPTSGSFLKMRAVRARLLVFAVSLACFTLATLFGYAYWRSGHLLDEMAIELNELEHRLAEQSTSAMSYSQVGPVLDRFHHLPISISPQTGEVDLPWTLTLMRLDDALSNRLMFLYRRALEGLLLPMIYFDLEELLRHAVTAAKEQPEKEGVKHPLYTLLRTYMLPFEKDHYRAEQFDLWQHSYWKNNSDHLSPTLIRRLAPHFAQLSKRLHPPIALKRDELLIAQARAQLADLSFEQRVLVQLQERAQTVSDIGSDVEGNKPIPPFLITHAAEPYAQSMLYRRSGAPLHEPIPPFYTKEGYTQLFKARLSQQVRESALDEWVLGSSAMPHHAQPDYDQLEARVTALYFLQYEKQWRALLDDVALKPLASGTQGLEQLEILGGDQSPMRKLLASVAQETALLSKAQPPLGDAFSELQALFEKQEDDAQPMDHLQGQIGQLHTDMSGLLNSPEMIDPEALDVNKAHQMMAAVGVAVPPYVESWVSSVAESAKALASEDALGALTKQWSSDVLPMCKHVVNRRFPFYPEERNQVSLVDFGMLFGYGGKIDQFFEAHLKGFADTSGAQWRWKASQPFSKKSIRAFQRAQAIRNGFFQRGGQSPFIEFDIAAKHMDKRIKKMELRLGEQSLIYKWGPLRHKRFTWPIEGDYNQASLYIDSQGELLKPYYAVEGPWSWFKLISEGRLQPLREGGSQQLTLALDEHEAAFSLNT